MSWIVDVTDGGPSLPDVLPSLVAAMETPGFTDALGLPPCRTSAVLLIDGLGWNLLREHATDAPFLAEHATREPLTVGFPTTTATSITSLGTGCASGEHGIVGYSFAEPSGGLLFPLSWSGQRSDGKRRNLLENWPPEQAQAQATMPERAEAAGVRMRIAVPPEFENSGLTRAALRGAEFVGCRALGDLGSALLDGLGRPGPTLCYGYHGQLDLLGHIHGPGSLPWRLQLAQVDRLVASVAERLPASSLLAVVADHGMVSVDPSEALDIDAEPALLDGVRLVGGEVRARHLYTRAGAQADVLAMWRERVGDLGLVLTRQEAIDRGWFGPVSSAVWPRIGDVVVVMRESGVIRSETEPGISSLLGQHGSLTDAERLVPLLVLAK